MCSRNEAQEEFWAGVGRAATRAKFTVDDLLRKAIDRFGRLEIYGTNRVFVQAGSDDTTGRRAGGYGLNLREALENLFEVAGVKL